MKKLDKFNCIVGIQNGKLCRCKIDKDGGPELWAGSLNWEEVRGPQDQNFLDAVNEALGTAYSQNDFERPKKFSEQKEPA